MNSRSWLWILVISGILSQGALNVVRPVTSYKLVALGEGGFAVGIVAASYALFPLVVALGLGRLADRIPQLLRMTQLSVATLAAGAVVVAAFNDLAGILLGTVLLGLGHLFFSITGQAAIARYSSDRQLDSGFGWFTASYSVGQAIGPPLGGYLVGSGAVTGAGRLNDVNTALWAGALLASLAIFLFLFPTGEANANRGVGHQIEDNPARVSVREILSSRGVASAIFAAMVLMAAMDILVVFLPLVGEQVGVSPIVIGWLLAVRGAAAFISRMLLPLMTARFSREVLLIASALVAGVALGVGTWTLPNVVVSAVLLGVGGFSLGLGQPLTMSLISVRVPRNWRSQALTLRLAGNRVGQIGFPVVAGVVAGPLGPSGAIWLTCIVLFGSGIEQLLHRDRDCADDV